LRAHSVQLATGIDSTAKRHHSSARPAHHVELPGRGQRVTPGATRPATTGGQQTDAPAMPRHEAPAAGEKEILHHL
jgi:hypothetical protein